MRAGGAARDLLDGVVPNTLRVRNAVVETTKRGARVCVGCVHHVALRAQSLGQRVEPFSEAVRVMEDQDFRHQLSVQRFGVLRTRTEVPALACAYD